MIEIMYSGTWLKTTLEDKVRELNDCIDEFLEETDEIINIQEKKDDDGTSRFIIFFRRD